MKRALFLIPLLALTLPVAQAETAAPAAAPAQAAKAAPQDAAKDAADKDAATPDTAAPEEKKEGDKTGDAAAASETEAVSDGNVQDDKQNVKAVDATRRLRDKLASVDAELATLSKPSRSLVQRCKSRKVTLTTQLERLDKVAMEVAALQEKFNSTNSREFEFTIVRGDERDKYVRDGQAAHKAMLIDMKEKKSSRKIGGLEKFEIMRDRYQGMPEYKEASEWYSRTIDDLEKRWSKMQTAEKTRREKLPAAKKQRMDEDDDRDFTKLEKQFKASGEEIAKVWYIPSARNLRMLNNCLNKVHDAQRRRESTQGKTNDSIGCVPGLLTQFWEMMDSARALLLRGDLEGAQKLIDSDPTFNRIVRLNRNVMPDEYKEPLKDQRQELIKEIRSRGAENTRTQRSLESKISELERTSSNIEARIDATLEEIERERGVDAGENTASIDDAELKDDSKDKQAKPEGSQPAQEAPKSEMAAQEQPGKGQDK